MCPYSSLIVTNVAHEAKMIIGESMCGKRGDMRTLYYLLDFFVILNLL